MLAVGGARRSISLIETPALLHSHNVPQKDSRVRPVLKPPSPAVEKEALVAWRSGDDAALLGVIGYYNQRLHRFFTGKVAWSDVDDLVQQTWEPILTRRHGEEIQQLRAFLFGVARNVLYAHWRDQRRKTSTDPFDSGAIQTESPSSRRIGAMDLRDALARLPMDLRLLLELYYGEDMTAEELAPVFGAPLGTIRSRLRRAKGLLAEVMSAGRQVASLPECSEDV